jgi:serine/threonine-protein kinase
VTAIEMPTPDPRTLDDEARPFAEAIALHYAIKREIGRGGNGVVYLARDRRLDRLVAIKTLPAHLAKDPSVRERFLREARTAGAMSHPNIVSIHSANENDAYVYFVMSLVEGESLAAHIRAHDRLGARVVACYLRDVASALVHAHSRGIIHRDIKAENVLIERESGRALVTDFGIARIAEATPLTATGQLLGTVYYVSPEQVSGAPVDARSDLYSLGVVGFLALTGTFPFESDLASAVLVAHVTKQAPAVASVQPDVPPALAAIIDRCLQKDPAARFTSALELVAALETVIAGLDNPAPVAPARDQRVSNTEAHTVWKRAAELQAMTGIQPRPTAIPGVRDAQKGRFGGIAVSDVRDAAIEAGIDGTYVEHALVEIGVATAGAMAPSATASPSGSTVGDATVPSARRSSPVVRDVANAAPTGWFHVAREFEVDGEVDSVDLERLIHVLRDETGKMGRVEAKSRELAWWTGRFGRRLDVSMVPARGRSTFRLTRDLTRSSLVAAIGTVATVGFGSTLAVVASVLEVNGRADALAVTLGFSAGAAASFFAARTIIRFLRRRTENRLRALGEKLAAKVHDHAVRRPHASE